MIISAVAAPRKIMMRRIFWRHSVPANQVYGLQCGDLNEQQRADNVTHVLYAQDMHDVPAFSTSLIYQHSKFCCAPLVFPNLLI